MTGIPLFGSKIILVRPEFIQANRTSNSTLHHEAPWGLNNRVSRQPLGSTAHAADCSIFAVHNGKLTSVIHMPSENFYSNEAAIRGQLTSDIEALRQNATQPLHAFITGGSAITFPAVYEELSIASERLFDLLKEIAQATEIPSVSILWGQRNTDLLRNGTAVLCIPAHDTFYISNQAIKPESIPNGVTEKDLKKAYRDITISPEDTFWVAPEPSG